MLQPPDGSVLVYRNTVGDPIAVPEEVVTAAERAFRCYKERMAGKSWGEIALDEHYPSATAAKYDVGRYMDEASAMVVASTAKEMLSLEVARLDAVQNALWLSAMTGHVPSAALVVNIIINRAKLIGLDPERMGAAADQARTVVVPAHDDGYTASLKRLAGEDPAK